MLYYNKINLNITIFKNFLLNFLFFEKEYGCFNFFFLIKKKLNIKKNYFFLYEFFYEIGFLKINYIINFK